jgi:prepilin-type N-terminal cleavage/methylation domain-containing protein
MRSLKKNARYGRHGESGFSLIEMMMVAAIGIIATAITFLSMGPVMKQQRITNAYNTTLGDAAGARQRGIAADIVLRDFLHEPFAGGEHDHGGADAGGIYRRPE